MTQPVGTCCLVLHTHLPWLAHAGAWPVGEEWLHQAWAGSYAPLTDVLTRLAAEGRRDLVTLGLTPVLAAQLDDPYCLREHHTWLAGWRLRAEELAARREPHLRATAEREFRAATTALERFEAQWGHGGSPVFRRLAEAGVVELLGGPATHPLLPLLDREVAAFAVRAGLDDARLRLGARPGGLWLPECGYSPGLETALSAAGVTHTLVDEATLRAAGRPTSAAWTVRDSTLVTVGRDLGVTDRVWSSRSGYPSGAAYRDFHAFDVGSGLRPYAVTDPALPAHTKQPYDPPAAAARVALDATDFVDHVRRRLLDVAAARGGRPGLVVAAWDTELFGHWWHEGPAFLEQVLRLLPDAGVRVATLAAVVPDAVEGAVDLPAGSWGAGKDFRVWAGPAVADIRAEQARAQHRLLAAVRAARQASPLRARSPELDQLAREALLLLSSDWAFMVSRDSAADYARERVKTCAERFARLADAIEGRRPDVAAVTAELRAVDGPFGGLDARLLAA